jgi:uncharacterized surface protein with fasciclin (FAS1) repeats
MEVSPMRPVLLAGLCAAALALLAACGDEGTAQATKASAAHENNATLASAVAGAAGMSVVAGALKGTGLASVFDGGAPYTLLAPTDDAFGALGEAGATLKAPENGAAMAAILKNHILPGYVALSDIDAALRKAKGAPVTMTTMAGGEVRFARSGEAVTVTGPDGSSAKVDGAPLTAANGVAIPIDAVLKKMP